LLPRWKAGNEEYEEAEPVEKVLTVKKANHYIIFDPLDPVDVGDTSFYLKARSSAPYEHYVGISYSSSNRNIASVTDTLVTIHAAETTIIRAFHSGDQNYEPAEDEFQELVVRAAGQLIEFHPPPEVPATTQTVHILSCFRF
jgi:hypothetical protein